MSRRNRGSIFSIWGEGEGRIATGLQVILAGFILVVFLMILVGGWSAIDKIFNDLLMGPIDNGQISGFALILLGVFFVMLFLRTRKKSQEEFQAEVWRSEARQRRRDYYK